VVGGGEAPGVRERARAAANGATDRELAVVAAVAAAGSEKSVRLHMLSNRHLVRLPRTGPGYRTPR
jgi:hypothetical protein